MTTKAKRAASAPANTRPKQRPLSQERGRDIVDRLMERCGQDHECAALITELLYGSFDDPDRAHAEDVVQFITTAAFISYQMAGTTAPAEAERFASAVGAGTPEALEVAQEYSRLIDEVMKRGRVCTPERVRALYPFLHEVKQEIDEIDREYAEFERRSQAGMKGAATRRQRLAAQKGGAQ